MCSHIHFQHHTDAFEGRLRFRREWTGRNIAGQRGNGRDKWYFLHGLTPQEEGFLQFNFLAAMAMAGWEATISKTAFVEHYSVSHPEPHETSACSKISEFQI